MLNESDEVRARELEELLAVSNQDVDEVVHAVQDTADIVFTWDYEKGSRPALSRLYEKAKASQWDAEVDLDWTIDVDPLRVLMGSDGRSAFTRLIDLPDSPLKKFGQKERDDLALESLNWRISQFLHGEQGGLLCAAKIVETVPWIDAKYYAATQVVDEARHVEAFAKYLDTKLTGSYPINAHLRSLLDAIAGESRWDIVYLGMQVMVEGLALAAFGFMDMMTEEPLLKGMLRKIMRDEARHVAFGVLSLREFYEQLTDAELRERQEFACEAAAHMRGRFLQQEVWDRLGVDKRDVARLMMANDNPGFGDLLFTKVVPNCKKLGLLDASGGWLRKQFEKMGIIQFEDWTSAEDEEIERAAANT